MRFEPVESIFSSAAVVDVLDERFAVTATRERIFADLAEHEAEGVRFLRHARELPDTLCEGWDREQHLRDEIRHFKYFSSIAKRDQRNISIPADLTEHERSVFQNPSAFLLNLHAAELFSAHYLQVLSEIAQKQGHASARSVLGRALVDERKHVEWVYTAMKLNGIQSVAEQTERVWSDLEVAFLDGLLTAHGHRQTPETLHP